MHLTFNANYTVPYPMIFLNYHNIMVIIEQAKVWIYETYS